MCPLPGMIRNLSFMNAQDEVEMIRTLWKRKQRTEQRQNYATFRH